MDLEPEVGSIYQDYSDSYKTYKILYIAFNDSDEKVVVYQALYPNFTGEYEVFVSLLKEFFISKEDLIPRFIKINEKNL